MPPQLRMVEDLSIEDDPLLGIVHGHRLESAIREVDDRQGAMFPAPRDRVVGGSGRTMGSERVTESAGVYPAEQEPFTIRSAVRLQVVHALQRGDVDRTAEADGAYDAAHRLGAGCRLVRIRGFPPSGELACGGQVEGS